MDRFGFVIDFNVQSRNVEDGQIDGHLGRVVGQDAQSRRRCVVAQIGARRFAGRCRTGLIGIGRCRVEDGAGEGSLLFHPPVHFVVASVARVQHALAAVDEDFEIQFQVDTGLAGILAASATSAASATTARILCLQMRKRRPEFLAGCDRPRYGGRRQFEWPGNS